MSAAIAVLEHRWAIPLRDAIPAAGGTALADEWLHPQDLVALRHRGGSSSGAAGARRPARRQRVAGRKALAPPLHAHSGSR